ncbi:MAG: hypothetical protein ACRELZ_11150 [Candidatus Rokuibacteriota bacterium]
MLGLPPETVYHHVREGVATVAGLCLLLLAVSAWHRGQLAPLAPMLVSGALLAALTPTVLMVRRRYRHAVAGALLVAVMLGVLAAAIHRFGNPATVVAVVAGSTPSAIADAVSPR